MSTLINSSSTSLTSSAGASIISSPGLDQSKTGIKDIPSELITRCIVLAGNSHTSKLVNKEWRVFSYDSFDEIVNGYRQHPKLSLIVSQIMQTGGIQLTNREIAERTRRAVLDRAFAISLAVPDPAGIGLSRLLERVEAREDEILTRFFDGLISQIPGPARPIIVGNLTQRAAAIRIWMGDHHATLEGITQLRFSGLGLNALPPEIGLFVNLQQLELSYNQLNNLPAEIGQLVNLQTLNLCNNQLNNLPVAIGQLVNLRLLNLGHNQLNTLPDAIGQLVHLQWLHLGHNQLNTLPAAIGQLMRLGILNLSNNQLNNLPAEIGQLVNLHVLELSYNELDNLPAEIGQLVNLLRLYLLKNLYYLHMIHDYKI